MAYQAPSYFEPIYDKDGYMIGYNMPDDTKKPMAPENGAVHVTLTDAPKVINTEVKPIAILLNPIADLKTLRPTFNQCDRVHSISDDTAGGIFVNHDANDVLAADANCTGR